MWKLKIADGGGDGGEKWLTTTNNHVGRQRWEFDADGGTPEERAQIEEFRQEFKKNRFRFRQSADLFMRMQLRKENGSCGEIPRGIKVNEREEIREEAMITTLKRAISFFSTIQAHDGHWPNESTGPLFLLPPLVMTLYITGDLDNVLSMEHKREMLRYTYNHQNEDGGWGLDVVSHSTMFGSILNYVTLRLLGEDADKRAVARARKWILDHGGAFKIPSWGKFLLTVLGVHEWEGCNPVPPELWLIPSRFPINPGMMYCFTRLVYLPVSYLYGKRFVGPKTGLVLSLRQELYTQAYDKINWNKARKSCAKEDLYYPHPLIQDVLWEFLHNFVEPFLTRWPFSKLREKALRVAMEHIHYEDENTQYISSACLEKELNLLACWVECPYSEAYKRHLARISDYYWMAEDGLKMQALSSQTWDASLAIQAILCSNLAQEYGPTLRKAHNFLKASQVRDNPSGDFRNKYRHISKGGWTFSMQDHGWQVSDCTAEALKAVLLCSQMPQELVGEEIETERLYDAVNIILSLQSASGGYPSLEPLRGPQWLEKFNPTEFFEDALIERDYVECTSSVIQGLTLFMKLHPGHRRGEIKRCISRAIYYIESAQERDGSWFGRWGICYTYGTYFAMKGLVACGKNCQNSDIVRKGCEFLVSKQLDDGGWGESHLSSSNKVYTNLEGNRSNLVQTSWALLALIVAGQDEIDPSPIQRGIRLLINSQMEDGDFPQQSITGVFMKTTVMNYASYRNIYPIWALAEYRLHLLRP